MSEKIDPGELPQATVVPARRTRLSVVWFVPILAAVVAIGIAIQRISSEGPVITLVFKSAEGIEAGKTYVKFKDVNIGQVTAVRLADDMQKVELTAQIDKSAAAAMVEDAKFWVVRPRVSLSGISGLGTLLSGNYIGFEPGKSTVRQLHFTGLEVPPVISGGVPGREFVLKTDDLGSLGVGSPVYYRRLSVGQIIAYDLAHDGNTIEIKMFIDAPNEKYIHPGTRFWNASGLNVSVGANGVDIRTESVLTLLEGGVAFDTPAFEPQDETAPADTAFKLYGDRDIALKQPDSIGTPYLLYFNESLRGLSVGAPVTLFGLPVGEVTDVGLSFDPEKLNMRPLVRARFFLERLMAFLPSGEATSYKQARGQNDENQRAMFKRMVEERKLRAQLRSGSLISGQMYVALDFFPNAPEANIDWSQKVLEMPVLPSTLPDIEAKLTSIFTKLDQLPFEAIGNDLRQELAALDQILKDAGRILSRADAELVPEMKSTVTGVNTTVAELRNMIASAEGVLKSADTTLVGPNAPAQQELRSLLQEVTRAARGFRVLVDYLERHPEALIRGKPDQESRTK